MTGRLAISGAQERRLRFIALRRAGLRMFDAASAVGVTDYRTVLRYERWFEAAERGEEIIPGRIGRPPSRAAS